MFVFVSERVNKKDVQVIKSNLIKIFIILFSFSKLAIAKAQDFSEEIEKDYALRSIGILQISHVKGDLSVQSWALDKVRIKIRKKVSDLPSDEAKRLLNALDYRYDSSNGNIGISTTYAKGLSIDEALKVKQNPSVQMDVIVFAPSNLQLKIWSLNGKVFLKNWNSNVEIRSSDGAIKAEDVKGKNALAITCRSCKAQLQNIDSSIHLVTEGGEINLHNIRGKMIYVETGGGKINLSNIRGDQLYITKKGAIDGRFLNGKIEFHGESASLKFQEVTVFLSGSLGSGELLAEVREWAPKDKPEIESTQGNIQLILPQEFSGELDISSKKGKTEVEFPVFESKRKLLEPVKDKGSSIVGQVGSGGELLRITSENGNIKVLRKSLRK